jgi:predicted DNA-binding protein YlxM (UPF0122 family)
MLDKGLGTAKLDELVNLSMLYDFYGDLFTEHKKHVFEDYVLNDLSLSEIADELNISRQGVHDIVKRCTQELKDYEDRLSLVKKFSSIKHKLTIMKELCIDIEETRNVDKILDIVTLADDILKEL